MFGVCKLGEDPAACVCQSADTTVNPQRFIRSVIQKYSQLEAAWWLRDCCVMLVVQANEWEDQYVWIFSLIMALIACYESRRGFNAVLSDVSEHILSVPLPWYGPSIVPPQKPVAPGPHLSTWQAGKLPYGHVKTFLGNLTSCRKSPMNPLLWLQIPLTITTAWEKRA